MYSKSSNTIGASLFVTYIESRRLRWAEHVARAETIRKVCVIVARKFRWKIQFGRSVRRWKNDIKNVS